MTIDLSNDVPMEFDRGDPSRRCAAHNRAGERCRRWAIVGGAVCATHGGRAPQVKRKARQRLEEAADRLAGELLKMATDPTVSESVRLSAIKDALDRGGVSAKTAVEVEVGPPKPWEQIMDGLAGIEGGSREEFRRSLGSANDQADVKTSPGIHLGIAVSTQTEAVGDLSEAVPSISNKRAIRRHSM